MVLPKQRIRVVAGTPIEVGDRRLLPSVLVNAVEGGSSSSGLFRFARMRPISIVEEGPEGARWIAIPNATADALSTMAAVGLGVALVSVLVIVLTRVVGCRCRSGCKTA